MADSGVNEGALVPTSATLPSLPDELPLRPVEGMARWLGRVLQPLAFRMISMIEQRTGTMSGPLTPVDGYFRRDRHRHPEVDAATWRLRITGTAADGVLTFDQLRALPREERLCVMECAGNGNHLMGSAGLLGHQPTTWHALPSWWRMFQTAFVVRDRDEIGRTSPVPGVISAKPCTPCL